MTISVILAQNVGITLAAGLVINHNLIKILEDADSLLRESEAIAEALGHELRTVHTRVDAHNSKDIPLSFWLDHARQTAIDPSVYPVKHWNPEEGDNLTQFEMSITDQRAQNSQVFIDILPTDSDEDKDGMAITCEISSLEAFPDTNLATTHVHFDSSNMAFSLFKANDSIYLRPETDVEVEEVYLMDHGSLTKMYRIK